MITRRDFLKSTGVGLGSIALPSWFVLPEPATDIQKYFRFLECDGRMLNMIPGYDAYELTSYIWCCGGKKPEFPFSKSNLKYYYGRTVISGNILSPTEFYGEIPYGRNKIAAIKREGLALFQKDIKESRNKLEALIKKELGTRNIWVFDSLDNNETPSQSNWERIWPAVDKTKPRYEMKLLKRI